MNQIKQTVLPDRYANDPLVRMRFIQDLYARTVMREDFPPSRIAQSRIVRDTLSTLYRYMEVTQHCPYSKETTSTLNNIMSFLENKIPTMFTGEWDVPVFTNSAIIGVTRMIRKDAISVMNEHQLPKMPTDAAMQKTCTDAHQDLVKLTDAIETLDTRSASANSTGKKLSSDFLSVLSTLEKNPEYILSNDSCAQINGLVGLLPRIEDVLNDPDRVHVQLRLLMCAEHVGMYITNVQRALFLVDKLA